VSRRAVAPVVGVSLLLAVTVVLAALVGALAIGVSGQTDNAPKAAITADIDGNKITLTHNGGDPLDVTKTTVRVFIDGDPLEQQPKVPATAGMDGFRYPPTGPFHKGNDNIWTVGETASFIIATTTNSPQPNAGSRVNVKIYSNGKAVATARA
jgi:flagellin-like protein